MTTQTKSLELSRFVASASNRIIAFVFLIYFAPVMMIVALLIKMDSQGPILTRQSHRGASGQMVGLLEFRTFIEEGVDRGRPFGLQAAQTEFGAFLRQSRLEMLPRLFNILRGEVSFGAFFR